MHLLRVLLITLLVLVIELETLREHHHAIALEIQKDETRRLALADSIDDLSAQLDRTNAALANKYAASERYERLIRETEDAYEKIVESSQTLLSVLQHETSTIVNATSINTTTAATIPANEHGHACAKLLAKASHSAAAAGR
ncbi:hypothetical protein HDU86_001194 [Geranomyces michiganensis]|nr:hypothetical protein HDU86_001194 [Geranomyces michiganensis]